MKKGIDIYFYEDKEKTVKLNNFSIGEVNNDDIIIEDSVKIHVKLPNYYFVSEYSIENGLTHKGLLEYIIKTTEKAIELDIKKYPLSYPKKITVKEILNSCRIIPTLEDSGVKMCGENVYVRLC